MMENLTVLSLTSSKTAVDILGTSGAGGKYSTLCRWLNSSAEEPTGPPGDAVYIFDNEQTVGKTWNIAPNNKVKCSVITNVAAASLGNSMKYQSRKELHPSQWFTEARAFTAVDNMLNESDKITQQLKQLHLRQLKVFIDATIEQAIEEQSSNKNSMDGIDKIVKQLNQERNFKVCLTCGMLVAKTKRKCPQCKEQLVKRVPQVSDQLSNEMDETNIEELILKGETNPDFVHEGSESFSRYEHIPSGHSDDPVNVELMDPVFVNPNSFDNLIMVMRHIGKISGVKRYGGKEREWLYICCDGLPYTMILRLTQEYFVCKKCKEGLLGSESWKKHVQQSHSENVDDVEHILEFDWVQLRTGDGHYEMNLMKSFVELNWEVCLKNLVQRMGWKSELAQKCAKKLL